MTMIHEQTLLEGLRELSDLELQANLWANADGNSSEMSSFEEAICFVFDDSGVSRAMEKRNRLEDDFGPDFVKSLAKLDSLVEQVPTGLPPEEVIRHPKMIEIRGVASELVEMLKSSSNLDSN